MENYYNDPIDFIENCIKISKFDEGLIPFKLYVAQQGLIEHFELNKNSIVKASRQSGLTSTTFAYILWAIWKESTTVLVVGYRHYNEIQVLLSLYSSITIDFPSIIKSTKDSIEFSNGSIIKFKSPTIEISGLSNDLILITNADLINSAQLNEILPMCHHTIKSDGKIILESSIANPLGKFAHIWDDAVMGLNSFSPYYINWNDIKGEYFKQNTIDLIGKTAWIKEYEIAQ